MTGETPCNDETNLRSALMNDGRPNFPEECLSLLQCMLTIKKTGILSLP